MKSKKAGYPLQEESPETLFYLKLANGEGWNFAAHDKPAKSWVESLGSILELRKGKVEGFPNLIFRFRKEEKCAGVEDALENTAVAGRYIRDLGGIHIRLDRMSADVVCEISGDACRPDVFRMWESLYPVYSRAQNSGGLPLHAALIEKSGRGVLLAGSSNAGKSTCCRRIPPPWRVLCDEEALIVRDGKGRYLAHPFPTWSRFLDPPYRISWNVEYCALLEAVFFLEKSSTDRVIPAGKGRTAMLIYKLSSEKCHVNLESLDQEERISVRKRLFENACELANSIPAFILRTSPAGRFWKEIEGALG
ncbi:MAG: SynChlorMet cassette protein ScmC [Syntrophales bacterium]